MIPLQLLPKSTSPRSFKEEPKPYRAPLDKNDHPELDNSDLVDSDHIQMYMTMVGQLQWAVTLGRFDILSQVMSMFCFRLASKQGHFDRVLWLSIKDQALCYPVSN